MCFVISSSSFDLEKVPIDRSLHLFHGDLSEDEMLLKVFLLWHFILWFDLSWKSQHFYLHSNLDCFQWPHLSFLRIYEKVRERRCKLQASSWSYPFVIFQILLSGWLKLVIYRWFHLISPVKLIVLGFSYAFCFYSVLVFNSCYFFLSVLLLSFVISFIMSLGSVFPA